MDINGTYFHLRTGENDWEPILAERGINNLWWDRERASLGLLPKLYYTALPPGKQLLSPEQRRGAAADQYGNFFWIDDSIEKEQTASDEQNDIDEAFHWLQKAAKEHDPWISWYGAGSDALRADDPRFDLLLKKIGLS